MSRYHWTPTTSGHILTSRVVGFAQALTPTPEETIVPKTKRDPSSKAAAEIANSRKP